MRKRHPCVACVFCHNAYSPAYQYTTQYYNTLLSYSMLVWWLYGYISGCLVLKAAACIDLTTLAGDDTVVNVQRLCYKVVFYLLRDHCILHLLSLEVILVCTHCSICAHLFHEEGQACICVRESNWVIMLYLIHISKLGLQ